FNCAAQASRPLPTLQYASAGLGLRQHRIRRNRLTVVANLEMQHRLITRPEANFGNLVANGHPIAFLDLSVAGISVGRQVITVMLEDDKLAKTLQADATVNHLAVARSVDWRAFRSIQINALANGFGLALIEHALRQRPTPALGVHSRRLRVCRW